MPARCIALLVGGSKHGTWKAVGENDTTMIFPTENGFEEYRQRIVDVGVYRVWVLDGLSGEEVAAALR